jgi:outer membrane receptor protein involved in Fe transport
LRPNDPTFIRFPAYALTTVRFGIKRDTWQALFNVQNLFNNSSTIADTAVIQGLYPASPIPNRPRTMTLTVSTSF